ncbi:hypothetical protein [Ferrimonas sp. YFM]|uniref:hypothetical protein n=1 Tax=Ferrimonas sp. YFM TaxID=3028878 RepID=UPI002572AC2E|nr:hypothetical protein [Ferrimonas sp. YFM]BDY04815.1 hypothetical protein F0521_18560 [Ferrimonas sp. YFM]
MKGRSILQQAFLRHFGLEPTQCFLSPLQLNLMGEICALSPGMVLCCGEDRYTGIAVGSRGDNHVRIEVCDHSGTPLPSTHPVDVTRLLNSLVAALQQRGYRLGGLHLLCTLPDAARPAQAMEAAVMALAYGLNNYLDLGLSASGLVKLCTQAYPPGWSEVDGSGQIAALAATRAHLSLVDYSRFGWQGVPLPKELALYRVDLDTRIEQFSALRQKKHQQARQVANFFSLSSLRDLTMDQLNRARGALTNELFGCARHLLSEQQRALNLADALVEGRLHEIGPLMQSAHLSLKREFGIDSRGADLMVASLNNQVKEQGGARLLSSGEVIALIPKARKTSIVEQVTQEYAQRFGVYATFFNINAVSGAHSVR